MSSRSIINTRILPLTLFLPPMFSPLVLLLSGRTNQGGSGDKGELVGYMYIFYIYILHFIFYILHFIFYILYFIFYILYFIFYILYFIFYILYFIFYILHFVFKKMINCSTQVLGTVHRGNTRMFGNHN